MTNRLPPPLDNCCQPVVPPGNHIVWIQHAGERRYLHVNGWAYPTRKLASPMAEEVAVKAAEVVRKYYDESGVERY